MKRLYMVLCGLILFFSAFSQNSNSERDFIVKLDKYQQLFTDSILSTEDLFVFWSFDYPLKSFLEGNLYNYSLEEYSETTQQSYLQLCQKRKERYNELIGEVASLKAVEQFIQMMEKYDENHITNNSDKDKRQNNIDTYYQVFEHVFFEIYCGFDIDLNYRDIKNALTDDQKRRIVKIYKKYDSHSSDKYVDETDGNRNMFRYIYVTDNLTSELEDFYNNKIQYAKSKGDIAQNDMQSVISLTEQIDRMTRDKIYRMLVTTKQKERLQNLMNRLEEWAVKYYQID